MVTLLYAIRGDLMSSEKQEQMSFEVAMQKLSEIVEKMEGGELPLAEALNQFEQGIKLARHSQTLLKEAEQKVQILSADHSSLQDFQES